MRRKRWISVLAGMLCTCMCVGMLPQGMRAVMAEEEETASTVYKRIQCHDPQVDYYAAVDETDNSKVYAATNEDYGVDNTVWIEEEAGTTDVGNRIVKLRSYVSDTYMGVEDGALKMMEDNGSDAIKWEVEVKWDDSGDWTGAYDFAWNRYKTLANDQNQYFCTQGLDGQAGEMSLMTPDNDGWWSNEWKYVEVSESELITKPGEAATEEQKLALKDAIDRAAEILGNKDGYRSAGVKKLQEIRINAEKVYGAQFLSGTTAEQLVAQLADAEANLENVEDSRLWPAGQMAIEGQDKIGSKGNYYLDFAEEFNDGALNTDVWLDEYLPHWTSDESKSQARYEMRDGKLVLQINEDDEPWSENDGKVVTSGIATYNKNYLHNFSGYNTLYEHPDSVKTDNNYFNGYTTQFGYVEMRAKLENDGGGGHQALWLVGVQDDTNDWDNSMQKAEIDMLETPYYATDTWRNCFYGWGEPNLGSGWVCNNEPVPMGDPGKEYHTYGMEWTPTELNFYYDGAYYMTIPYSPQYEMCMILSLYVNAGFSGTNIGKEPADDWPKEFCVDYLRVYKPEGGYDNGYVDKTTLEELLGKAEAEAAKADLYRADSLEGLKGAIAEARAVYENGTAAKADVLEQTKRLQTALENLIKKEDEAPGKEENTGTENKPAAGTNETINTSTRETVDAGKVKTGDSAPPVPIVLIMGAAVIAAAGITIRKKIKG